jgi:hypothetical protein
MGDKLTDKGEVLYRQIHPSFIDDGVPSKQPFMPTPKDAGKLSVDRAELTSAKESYALYTGSGRQSVAVYGVSVGEFEEETIACFADPLSEAEDQPENKAHAVADYSPHSSNQQKLKATRLKQKAITRGQLHP